MRSGDGGRDGGRGAAKPGKSIPLAVHQANPAGAGGYGLSMFPANKYDQQQQIASKAQKATGNTSALTSSTHENQSTQNQNQKSHQQSMQKFLQQQMTHYNTSGNQSSSKNTKKASGLKSSSKQSNGGGSLYQQLPQGHQGQG